MVGKLNVEGGGGRRRWVVLVNIVYLVEVEELLLEVFLNKILSKMGIRFILNVFLIYERCINCGGVWVRWSWFRGGNDGSCLGFMCLV